jgi:hypothetical protein
VLERQAYGPTKHTMVQMTGIDLAGVTFVDANFEKDD